MLVLDARNYDFVVGSVISALGQTTGFLNLRVSWALPWKEESGKVEGTSSLPCARSAEYFLCPVTVHSIVPPRRKRVNTPGICTFWGKCPMIVPFSQPQRNRFRGYFHRTTTIQPLPPIFLYICGSLEYNSFWKTLPWQLLSPCVSSPCSSLPLLACMCRTKVDYATTNAVL